MGWIGEGIAETVREALASQGVLVLDREDRLEAYRRLSLRPDALLTHASVIKVGESLDAETVIYGQYELTPPAEAIKNTRGSLRITARILNIKRLKQGGEFAEIGALEDLAALETHLSWQTLQFLLPKSAPSEQEFLQVHPPVRVDAMESYIRGLLATSPEQMNRLFNQAARLDDRYSQPCFQLGKIYWNKKEYAPSARWLTRVRPSDSRYLEAQFFLGLSLYATGDFLGAEKAFQIVAAQVPLNEVYNDLGAAQARLSKGEAIENFRKALEGDSADPDYHFNLGYTLWRKGQFAPAADSFRAVLDRNPNDSEAMTMLGRALKQDAPHLGDPRTDGRERLKLNYEETAYRQLKAELESKK
ncbi:MAG TPA: tetratricopeptide repeat protein [Bryobacteraceae bacterium]|nr:tetratricopeptide repeat protein [Bryobacteraceae bacterium]